MHRVSKQRKLLRLFTKKTVLSPIGFIRDFFEQIALAKPCTSTLYNAADKGERERRGFYKLPI